MSTTVALLISAVLIAVNAFFVGVEISFVAARQTKLDALSEEGAVGARIAASSVANITSQLFAAQFGITAATLVLGLIAEQAVAEIIENILDGIVDIPSGVLHTIGFLSALALVAFVHTVWGEMVPKNIAIARPETSARMLAPLHHVAVTVLAPIIWFLKQLAKPLLKLADVDPDELGAAHTPAELVRMIDASRAGGLVEEQNHALLKGALDWGDIGVRSVMIPIEHILSISRDSTVHDIENLVARSGHSRLPVMGGAGHDIIGFVHAKDLLRLPDEAEHEAPPLEVIRRMLTVGVDLRLEEVLVRMKKQRTHIALVEGDGGVLGMITLEDILEELVGEIYDETD
ncbi:MAG: hemolysin family protein [Acidimicrobiales bacterium]